MPLMMTMGGAPVSRLRSGPPSCCFRKRGREEAGSKVAWEWQVLGRKAEINCGQIVAQQEIDQALLLN